MISAKTKCNKEAVYLLSIVEVDREDRILCQVSGCGHSVYKRIHVVLVGTEFKILGSQCYQRLYGNASPSNSVPQYGSAEGRHLTDEERRLLVENTAMFIESLEAKRIEMEMLVDSETISRQRESDAREKMRQQLQRHQKAQVGWLSRHTNEVAPAYDISNMLNWKWMVGVSREAVANAYKRNSVLNSNFDIILQCLKEKAWATPYTFALYVEGKYFLPKGNCLEALDKLGLVEQYR